MKDIANADGGQLSLSTRRTLLRALGASAVGVGTLGTGGSASAQASLPDPDAVEHTWAAASDSSASFSDDREKKRITHSLSVSSFGTNTDVGGLGEEYFEAAFKVDSLVDMYGLIDSSDWSDAEPMGGIYHHEVIARMEDGVGEFPYGPRSGVSLYSSPQEGDTPFADAFWEVGVGILAGRAKKVGKLVGDAQDIIAAAEFVQSLRSDDEGVSIPRSNRLAFQRQYPNDQRVKTASMTMFVRAAVKKSETPAKIVFDGSSYPAVDLDHGVKIPVYVNEQGAALDPQHLDEPFSATIQGPSNPPAGSTQTYTVTHDEREYEPIYEWRARYPGGTTEKLGTGRSIEFEVPRSTDVSASLSVEVDPADLSPVTAVTNVAPSDYAPDLQFESVDAPDGTVGRPYGIDVDWSNAGGTGDATVTVDAYDPDAGEHLGTYYTVSGQVEEGASASTSLQFRPDDALTGTVDLVVEGEPGERVERTVTFEALDEPILEFHSLVASGGTVGEEQTASLQYENHGAAGEATVELRVLEYLSRDLVETVAATVEQFEAGATGALEVSFTPPTGVVGHVVLEATSDAGESVDDRITFEAPEGNPQVQVTDMSVKNAYVDEPATVTAGYENEGGAGTVTFGVEALGEQVAESEVVVEGGSEGSAEVDFVPTEAYQGETSVLVDATVDGTAQSYQQILTTFGPERTPTMDIATLNVSEGHVAEQATATAEWTNRGGDGQVTFSVVLDDDETVATKSIEVEATAEGSTTIEFVPSATYQGETSVLVDATVDGTAQSYQQVLTTYGPKRDTSISIEKLEAADGYVGASTTVSADYVNEGGPGTVEFTLGAEEHRTTWSETVEVEGGVSGSVNIDFTPQTPGQKTLGVEATVAGELHDFQQILSTYEADASPKVEFAGLEVPDGTVGESYELSIGYENAGGPGERPLEVRALDPNDETTIAVLTTQSLSFDAGSGTVTVEFVPPASIEGEVILSAALDAGTYTTSTGLATFEAAGPTCTTVDGQTVCDVNGDGLYRDVNGDEDVGHADVQAFFDVQHRPAWKQPSKFDFNGNEMVGHGDVQALFEYVATGSLSL